MGALSDSDKERILKLPYESCVVQAKHDAVLLKQAGFWLTATETGNSYLNALKSITDARRKEKI